MNRIPYLLRCIVLFGFGTISMNAQSDLQNTIKNDTISLEEEEEEEEEEGPIMFKFEPDFLSSRERRLIEMSQTRQIIDTLDISESKRRRLLKDLYKNGLTKRLSKALVADNKFEEVDQ